ncbi:MAG: hypothetical protein AAGA48_28775 [Myxococcota bacterium]
MKSKAQRKAEQAQERLKGWLKELNFLNHKLTDLLGDYEVYQKSYSAVRSHPQFNVSPQNDLFIMMREGFMIKAAVAIRAISDDDQRTRSYHQLLTKMVNCYSDLETALAKENWRLPTAEQLSDWRDDLIEQTKSTKTFTDRAIAHWDKKDPGMLSLLDIQRQLYWIRELHKRVFLVLHGGGLTVEPAKQYNWEFWLQTPWLTDSPQQKEACRTAVGETHLGELAAEHDWPEPNKFMSADQHGALHEQLLRSARGTNSHEE